MTLNLGRPRLATLIVEVTQACDHACVHCYNYWNHPAYNRPLLPDGDDLRPLLAHVLDQVECSNVTLTGGEPTLRADLPELVGFLAARGHSVNLISNGHRLSDTLVDALIGRGVSLFELPLLSYRREVHDGMSAAPGAFDAVLAALAEIRRRQGQAVCVFVATRRNLADLEDTLRLAFAFGARGVMLNRFNPGGRGSAHIGELLPSVGEMQAALEVAERVSRRYELPISCSIPLQPCLVDMSLYPSLGYGFCAAGSERAYYTLDTAGNLRPCNHTPTVLGNVWRQPLAEMMQGEALAAFKAALPERCRPCPRRDECQGGCKAAAQVCYGDLRAEEPFLRQAR